MRYRPLLRAAKASLSCALQGEPSSGTRFAARGSNHVCPLALACPLRCRYGASKWTKRELQYADKLHSERGRPVVLPVWHSGPFPPPKASIFFSSTQRVPQVSMQHSKH